MRGVLRSLLVSLWFMLLTFPLLAIKINPSSGAITWRLSYVCYLGAGIFVLSFFWRAMLVVRGVMTKEEAQLHWLFAFTATPRHRDWLWAAFVAALGLAPLAFLGAQQALLTVQNLLWPSLGLVAAFCCLSGVHRQLAPKLQTTATRLVEPGWPRLAAIACALCLLLPLPLLVDTYQVNVLAQAFIWIMLGLGLNIVVGQTGLLVLGYIAFYAVGAYTYALGNLHFGGPLVGFWLFLPLGGLLAAVAGIAVGLPVLRLRGDYLAIVTLGFGEIVRVVLESGSLSLAPVAALYSIISSNPAPAWMTTSLNLGGPAGIGGIPYPGLAGVAMGVDMSIRYVYYIALGLTILTIFAVSRLRDSRLGRSWLALREDEIACEAMGVNTVFAELTVFALGACWAGFGGVLFAAKTTFINPASFTFMESALVLSVVVLGGLGSILGVTLGACVLILLPEYLRFLNEYRMLIFGASMVLMMVFRPQGLIPPLPKRRVLAGRAKKHTKGAA